MGKTKFEAGFEEKFKKIKNRDTYTRLSKLILKIKANPQIGKPMQYSRKGTREVYFGSFRLSYKYFEETDTLIFTDIYHKDFQ